MRETANARENKNIYLTHRHDKDFPKHFNMSPDSIKSQIYEMGALAREAALKLSLLSSEQKNEILIAMAEGVRAAQEEIILENKKDLVAGEENNLSMAMLDRLRLDEKRIEAIAAGIEKVATLPDPCGEVLLDTVRPNGIKLQQLRVPIGTIGIIYESRPNVTSDAAVLCLKSGNATILRGGKEAIHSNRIIAKVLGATGEAAGMPKGAIQLIPFTDRASVAALAGMDKHLDLIIPRGGKGLVETVVSLARMPVIKHYDGICHMFIDKEADLKMATALAIDAKTQKPSVCNALETLLVHADIATEYLPLVAEAYKAKNTTLICDETASAILKDFETVDAIEEDWSTEYLDYKIAIKVVPNLESAIQHINTYGSKHSDAIVTQDDTTASTFLRSVDSACVYHNVSTRFSDGEEFGFGAEIGVSTDKLHARGPMGLKELTSYQYRITGNGQTKA